MPEDFLFDPEAGGTEGKFGITPKEFGSVGGGFEGSKPINIDRELDADGRFVGGFAGDIGLCSSSDCWEYLV